jgi:hypothetical protein
MTQPPPRCHSLAPHAPHTVPGNIDFGDIACPGVPNLAATTAPPLSAEQELDRLDAALRSRGVIVPDDEPTVTAALDHIDRLTEATRDGLAAWQRDILDRFAPPVTELEAIVDGGLTDQEIRVEALRAAATLGIRPESPAAGDESAAALATVTIAADIYEPYIRHGETHTGGNDIDIPAAIHTARERIAHATSDVERAEAVSDLLGEWYAAWPPTAVTDMWDPIATEIVQLLRGNSDIVDAAIAYVQEPEDGDNEQRWHELKQAVEHHLAVTGRADGAQ